MLLTSIIVPQAITRHRRIMIRQNHTKAKHEDSPLDHYDYTC